MAKWVRALAWGPDGPGRVRIPLRKLHFGTLAIPFTPLALKAVGPFYLVSMPGEVKDPTSLHGNV